MFGGDPESLCKFVKAKDPYLGKPDTKISCAFSSGSNGYGAALENWGPSRKALPGSCNAEQWSRVRDQLSQFAVLCSLLANADVCDRHKDLNSSADFPPMSCVALACFWIPLNLSLLVGRDTLYLRGVVSSPPQWEYRIGELIHPKPCFYGNRRILWEMKTCLHIDGRLGE